MKYLSINFFLLIGFAFVVSCSSDDDGGGTIIVEDKCENITVSYNNDILPLVNTSCAFAGCHVYGFANGSFQTYDGLKEKVDNGSLQREVVDNMTMPKTGAISQEARDAIECWIAAGGPNN